MFGDNRPLAGFGRLGHGVANSRVLRSFAIPQPPSNGHRGLSRTASLLPPIPAHVFVACIRAADILAFLASGVLASRLCAAFGGGLVAGEPVLTTVAAAIVGVLTLQQMDAYAPGRLCDFSRRVRAIAAATLVGGLVAALCFELMPAAGAGLRAWPAIWMVLTGGLCAGEAWVSAAIAQTPRFADKLVQRVAVVGVNPYSHALIAGMAAEADPATSFVGLYDDDERPWDQASEMPVAGQIKDLLARSRRERIDAIVLALPLSDRERISNAHAALRCATADIYLAADIFDLTCKDGQVDRFGRNAVIKIGSRPLSDWQRLQKGALDGVLSAVLVIGALPFLLLIALAIRLDSPGPVLFRQPRMGFNNVMIDVFKFRTMYHHMADLTADRQTTRGDSRITRVGRILRKLSIDELPQLLNVLRGEMSLVGPRPHAPNTKAGDQLFHDAVADYALRHRVKPGITGWAQVNGWRGETRTIEQIEQRVAHDLYYIDNWSLRLDIKIMLLTALREVNSKSAF